MYEQESTQKRAAENLMQSQAVGLAGKALDTRNGEYRPSAREEAEKASYFHAEKAQKASQAADFLRENPAFNEFVRLLRVGAIQLY